MKVSDIMAKEVIAVKKSTSIIEAAGILTKFRIHGMPVVDNENKVVGIITESDFFTKDSSNIYLPTFLEFIFTKNNPKEKAEKSDVEKITRVEDIMTENCRTIKPDLSVKGLIDLIKESTFNTFPVVDDSGTLRGVVTVLDIIKLL